MNVILVHYPLEGVRGFYQYFNVTTLFIWMNGCQRLSNVLSLLMTGAYVLHKRANAIFMDTRTQFNTNKFEKEANTFAIELLVPDTEIVENPDLTIEQLARMTGYSEELLKYKNIFMDNTP